VRLAKLVAASIQASWIDDSPTKLPVATKCKTAELAEIDPACAAPVTSDRLPSVPPGAFSNGISRQRADAQISQAAPNSDCKASSFSSAIVATTVMMRKFPQETALLGCVLIAQLPGR